MRWEFNERTGLFAIKDLTPSEMGITVAAIIAGVSLTTVKEAPFSAEAARANLIQYMHNSPDSVTDTLLTMWTAADEFRIRHV